ncbi:MAG: ATP-binding cassette domain-containing protein [Lachnospiraceae bacterium]|nr:ATP-binding cassette domain-containing protein [Lachnospiraceae bacterium]
MAIIEVRGLSKTFMTKDDKVEALKDIDLTVEEGDIYGIIGMSGAGKSTLVRCLNYLETPSKGTVSIEGRDLGKLSGRQLRDLRSRIGMIFQSFNLLMQKTVIDNVCFPLLIHGTGKEEAKKKALELLETVGLADKKDAYPAQLSGGQKQRVAIARSLACDPKILLCDEATSALDPQTTAGVLDLLRRINETRGITIVIITHQMSVVRDICKHVAIVEEGRIVELGLVEEIFRHPKSRAARQLIIDGKDPDEWSAQAETDEIFDVSSDVIPKLQSGYTRIRIVFGGEAAFEPIISAMTVKFGIPFNILKADIKPLRAVSTGEMVLEFSGGKQIQEKVIGFLQEKELGVQVIGYQE